MDGSFSERVNEVIRLSREEALRLGDDYIGTEHLLLGVIRCGEGMAVKILKNLGLDLDRIRRAVEDSESYPHEIVASGSISLTKQSEKVLRITYLEAKLYKSDIIGTEHLLLSLLREDENIASAILHQFGVTYDVARTELDNIRSGNATDPEMEDYAEPRDSMPDGRPISKPAWKEAEPERKSGKKEVPKTPVLDNFGRDLTQMAMNGELDPVIGRESEIERVTQVLSRRKKNNPVLIGEPGVGKTAIVEGLAIKIITRKVPSVLFDKRIVSLDLSAMVAGTKYRGQFEERIKSVMTEIQKAKNVILFIDEIHTMVGAGSATGTLDAANILKPALSRGEIQCVGATTLDEYRQYIEKDGALERRFRKIIVEAPKYNETIDILKKVKSKYEVHHHVKYSDKAIEACVRFSDRYITDRAFPDKAIDVMDEAGARVRLRNVTVPKEILRLEKELDAVKEEKNSVVKQQNFEEAARLRDSEKKILADIEDEKAKWNEQIAQVSYEVHEEDIADIIAMMTGVPVNKIAEKETEKLLSMPQELKSIVVAQDEAVDTLVKAIRRARAGLKDPKRPIGSFMFLGPTGVGKTELAKALARVMFDSEDALIRVDMSEYMEKFSVSRLGGAPPGYVGYEEGGQLTEKVRRKPYSIVLLDEIEKAHPDVFNTLLQVFDDGVLTDGTGRKVDFKNTIIIMTSNVGTKDIKAGGAIGFDAADDKTDYEHVKETIEKSVKTLFNPEFINRVDDFIVFRKLRKVDISKIIDIQLNLLQDRLSQNYMKIELSDEARNFLIDKGFDENYGARPLKRAVQKYVENELADAILGGKIKTHSLINIDVNQQNDALTFSSKELEGEFNDADKKFIDEVLTENNEVCEQK